MQRTTDKEFTMDKIKKILSLSHTTDKLVNTLVVGGSGSGKTHCFVVPNILAGYASYVVYDTFGDILKETYNVLISKGYEVREYNFEDIEPSSIDMSELSNCLGNKRTAVFITHTLFSDSLPREKWFVEKLINLLWLNSRLYEDSKLPVPVEFFFDEYANGPALPNMSVLMRDCSDTNITFNLIIHSVRQLCALCDKIGGSAEDIARECSMLLQFGKKEPATAMDFFFDDPTDISNGDVKVCTNNGDVFVDKAYNW